MIPKAYGVSFYCVDRHNKMFWVEIAAHGPCQGAAVQAAWRELRDCWGSLVTQWMDGVYVVRVIR